MCATLRLNSSTFEILNSTGKIFSFFTNMWNFVFHIFHKVCGIQFSTISTKNVEFSFLQFPQKMWNSVFQHFPQIMWNSVFNNFHKVCRILFLTVSLNHFQQTIWNSVFHIFHNVFSRKYVEYKFPHFSGILWTSVSHIFDNGGSSFP